MAAISNATAEAEEISAAAAVRRQSKAARASTTSEPLRRSQKSAALPITLSMVVISVRGDEPMISTLLVSEPPFGAAFPRGTFDPSQHQSLDVAARAIAKGVADLALGYIEQLIARVVSDPTSAKTIEIGYLALLPPPSERKSRQAHPRNTTVSWQSAYVFLPWEDWRHGRPGIMDGLVMPRLQAWARSDEPSRPRTARNRSANARQARIRFAFGTSRESWDETRVVERFDVLADAGIIVSSDTSDASPIDNDRTAAVPESGPEMRPEMRPEMKPVTRPDPRLGQDLQAGERRLLAVALSRLRAALKTRPVVFELLPDEFTLFELQRTVETLLGPVLHKQNFRRQIETTGLVEATGRLRTNTGGRPAKLFRFSKDVLVERPAAEPQRPRISPKRPK